MTSPSKKNKKFSFSMPPVSKISYGIRNENRETWSTTRIHPKPNPLRIHIARVVGTFSLSTSVNVYDAYVYARTSPFVAALLECVCGASML